MPREHYFLTFFTIFFLFSCIESYKVLLIYPIPVKSLSILGQGFVRHLLNAGHEVTYMTVYPLKNVQNKNFRQIDISGNLAILDSTDVNNMSSIMEGNAHIADALWVQQFTTESARLTFANENVKKFMDNKNEKFDVVIADLCETEVYSAFAVLYGCPMIWTYSMGAHWNVLRLIDEPTNPAYDPDYLSLNLFPFTFRQRLEELWTRIIGNYYRSFITGPIEEEFYKKYFGPLVAQRGRILPEYEDVVYNASFIFGNEHNAIKYKPSTPENFKNIGGFHIEEPPKPLPKDLQDLMDGSPDGVIYFSMGSFWEAKMLPKGLVTQLLEVFGELKQTVIWKFEDKLPNVPKNVHIMSWAPQPSILAHPNCRFFITHGGLLSSIEAVHFGVPTIGVPINFDQFININKALSAGYTIKVDLNYDLPKNMRNAIEVMLNDDRYTKKAKELSAIYHDRPMSPGDELVHWVQHVVRTRGALHLRSPALHVPLYQKLYLDLLAVILVTFVCILMLLNRCLIKRRNVDGKRKSD